MITCASCKADASYLIRDYLDDLAEESGIGAGLDHSGKLEALKEWGVIEGKTSEDEPLKAAYALDTLGALTGIGDMYDHCRKNGWLSADLSLDDRLSKAEAAVLIGKAVGMIDAVSEKHCSYTYAEGIKDQDEELQAGDIVLTDEGYRKVSAIAEGKAIYEEAKLEEVFDELDVSTSFDADLEQAEIIPYGTPLPDGAYVNELYELLAAKKTGFEAGGFRITYSVSKAGIDIHAVKDTNGFKIFGDLSLSNIHPEIRWHSKKDDLKNCLMAVRFKTAESLGASDGRYGDYRMRFKDLDSSSFKTLLNTLIVPRQEKAEASLPICKIRIPIPDVPGMELDLDILIRLFADGRVELNLSQDLELGFETKNGHIRIIKNIDNELDTIVQASAKAGLGLNLGLSAASIRLADVELDGGVKGDLRTTLHLYDEEGGQIEQASMAAYSVVTELAEDNEDVKVCGDVSLYWFMDLIFNTAGTRMAKMGLSRTFSIMNEENQIFGNLHHIENGHFVEKCTRKNKIVPKQMSEVVSDRLTLSDQAKVLRKGETYQIIVRTLPTGYELQELRYSSEDPAVATVTEGLVKAVSPGSVRIRAVTADGRYTAYLNILVSTE